MGKAANRKRHLAAEAAAVDTLTRYQIQVPVDIASSDPIVSNFYLEQVALVLQALSGSPSVGRLCDIWERLLAEHVRLQEEYSKPGLDSSGRRLRIACTKGCNYCCYLRVTCYAPEVIALARRLRLSLGEEEIQALMIELEAYESSIAPMSATDKVIPRLLCPLNKQGVCTVYPWRPVSCSGFHSYDVEKCRLAHRITSLANIALPQSANRLFAKSVISQIMGNSLERLGLDSTEFELIPALIECLRNPETGVRYLDRQPVLQEANRPDVRRAAEAMPMVRPESEP